MPSNLNNQTISPLGFTNPAVVSSSGVIKGTFDDERPLPYSPLSMRRSRLILLATRMLGEQTILFYFANICLLNLRVGNGLIRCSIPQHWVVRGGQRQHANQPCVLQRRKTSGILQDPPTIHSIAIFHGFLIDTCLHHYPTSSNTIMTPTRMLVFPFVDWPPPPSIRFCPWTPPKSSKVTPGYHKPQVLFASADLEHTIHAEPPKPMGRAADGG